ncbi:MAG TPA: hypothetical protein VMR14_10270 [Streptosporangiaceae bacterium]|jgi:hypothetical protein|nr:hypothetical protein [Streptosporangiaceae bacterium]
MPADLMGWDQDNRPAGRRRLPSVRLAPREDLASLARVAPLLRAARDLDEWVSGTGAGSLATATELKPALARRAASALDLAPREVVAAWRVLVATRDATMPMPDPSGLGAVLGAGTTEAVLEVWDTALTVVLASEELDGIATALYTVGGPVGIDGLFDAYASAAGSDRAKAASPGPDGAGPAAAAAGQAGADAGGADYSASEPRIRDHGTRLSLALETLADLAVVELGTEDADGSLTVSLSPLGTWGVHRRLRAQGWHVPVLGAAAKYDAPGLLAALANCDAEDGEAEITTWLAARDPAEAAAELIDAAATGSPGQRGAAFAVLDRIGLSALEVVRAALDHPLLRAHAAVWLLEHGENTRLDPQDRTWLLVDLGAGLLEEANPQDVVAELLPNLPPEDQAEIVASLWQVSHPGVTDLLTALSDHHPDPSVARAARKAAFKARSPAAAD